MSRSIWLLAGLLAGCGPGINGMYQGPVEAIIEVHGGGDNVVSFNQPWAATYTWQINSCGGSLAIEAPQQPCLQPAVADGDGWTLEAGHHCQVTADDTYTSLGGTFTMDGADLVGTASWRWDRAPSDGAFRILKHQFRLTRVADASANRCGALTRPQGLPISDVAALVGCGTFSNLAAAGATRDIAFDLSSYTPRCMQIAVGQAVTFNGPFASCGLGPGLEGEPFAGTPATPLVLVIAGTTRSFTFSRAGDYPYHCRQAPQNTGLIRVR